MAHRLAIAVLFITGSVLGCSYTSPEGGVDAANEPPVVFFEFPSSGADEGAAGTTGSTVLIPVVLSKPAESRITVTCTALSGSSASEVTDFVVNTHDLVFEIGDTRQDVSVDVLKDVIENEGESFQLALTEPVGATLDPERAIHLVNISDTILPRIRLQNPSTTTAEGTPTMLELRLDLPADGPSSVVIGVTPGANPIDSEDITLAEGTVVDIASGEMVVQVPIGETPDDLFELDENVTFELKGASQNLVIDASNKVATHTITNDDTAPVVDFAATTSNFNEDTGTATITVRLSAESGLPVTINYSRDAADTASASDATVNGTSVTFAPRTVGVAGETMKTITVQIVDDGIDEDPETVIVDLANNPTNATRGANITHTLTINADATDPPSVVSWNATTSSRTEGNATHNIQINITPASGKTIIVPFSINGSSTAQDGGSGSGSNDYDLNTTSPFTIQPGNATFTFRIDVNGDGANESNETVIIDLGTPTQNGTLGTNTQHTFTINDND